MPSLARMSLFSIATAWVISLVGCPAGQSSRCRDLCQGVVTCIESSHTQSDMVIDETECTITCTSLERDPEGRKMMDQYAQCVHAASDCTDRLACNLAVTHTQSDAD